MKPFASLHGLRLLSRRSFLSDLGISAGGLALAQLLARDVLLAAPMGDPIRPKIDSARPFAARVPHYPAKADQLLIIFCAGAVSHLDSWDNKPEVCKFHGQEPPHAPKVTFEGPIGKMARPFGSLSREDRPARWCRIYFSISLDRPMTSASCTR